jgi:hypothetical protein
MKDSRTVRRSFVARREAQGNWQQLFRVLLEIGGAQLAVSGDTPPCSPVIHPEVLYERRCLCTGLDVPSGPGSNDHTTSCTLTGQGAGGGLDARHPPDLLR